MELRDYQIAYKIINANAESMIYKVAEQKSITLFPELKNENYINLESRRYIGSKAKLTNWIIETLLKETRHTTLVSTVDFITYMII